MAPRYLTSKEVGERNCKDRHERYFAYRQVGEVCGETNSGARDYTGDSGDTVWYVTDDVVNFHFKAKQIKTPENKKYGMHWVSVDTVVFLDAWDLEGSRARIRRRHKEAGMPERLEIEGHITKAEGVSACRHSRA